MDEIVDYAAGHQRYGVFLVNSGRSDEGLRELKRALELDPASLPINAEKAYTERVPFCGD
jgi:hypothetical protein